MSKSSKEVVVGEYHKYLINHMEAVQKDDHFWEFDNDFIKGELFYYEEEEYRVITISHLPYHDIEVDFYADPTYKYTISCYASNILYTIKNKVSVNLNSPSGFLVLNNTKKYKFKLTKGEWVHRVIFFIKDIKSIQKVDEIMNKVDSFIYHIGDVQMSSYKNLVFDHLLDEVHSDFHNELIRLKNKELFYEVLNLLYNYKLVEVEDNLYRSSEFKIVYEIKDHILSDLQSKPSISKLTREYGIHQLKLNAIFKHCFQKSIYQFYTDERLKKAKIDIENTNESFAEIAYNYGFTDSNHLSKKVKKAFGVSPSQLRNQHK